MNELKYDIGIVVTAHYSNKLRKNGKEYLESMVSSVEKHLKVRYKIFVMDNESETPFQSNDKYSVTRFENQIKGGLSRTWNCGVKLAYESNCEIIIVCNDDIMFTDSVNDLHQYCVNNEDRENCFIGPISDGAFNKRQRGSKSKSGVKAYSHRKGTQGRKGYAINGLCQAFHKDFYVKYKVNGKLWNIDGKSQLWGGEEYDLYDRCNPLGMRSIVYRPWFVKHHGIHGWKKI